MLNQKSVAPMGLLGSALQNTQFAFFCRSGGIQVAFDNQTGVVGNTCLPTTWVISACWVVFIETSLKIQPCRLHGLKDLACPRF
jgi:hypothetical protein